MDPEFLKRLQEAFVEEATEQMQVVRSCLMMLERDDTDKVQAVESLLRTFHSLKGSSRAVNLRSVEMSCQVIENVLVDSKGEESNLSRGLIDRMYEYVDALEKVVDAVAVGKEPPTAGLDAIVQAIPVERVIEADACGQPGDPAANDPQEHTGQFVRLAQPGVDDPAAASGVHRTASMGVIGTTVRLKVNRVEDLVHGAEELVYAKLVADQRYIDCGDLQLILNQWLRRWQRLRPEVENEVQRRTLYQTQGLNVTGLQEFLDLHDSFVGRLTDKLNTLERAVLADRRTVGSLIDTILEQSRELTMIPFAVLQDLCLKLVKDIARDQGKLIALRIIGGAVEIDRHILDELREPLLHLLRNAVDHGVETPDEREAAGKPPEATIEIQLSPPQAGKVEIVVRDDGRGIDPEKIKQSAVEKGLMTYERARELSFHDALGLIFRSSFSTRGTVSDLSGRGLGCAIVKDKLEQLGGSVEVSSKLGKESKFRIAVPVRRATMVGIAVAVGGRTFLIPTASIRAAVRARDQEIRVVEGKQTVIFHERLVPMVSLADVLHIDSSAAIDDCTILVVGSDDYPIALLVEDIFGEQEVAVKNLPAPLSQVRNIGGAALLKTGDLAVVVNMNDVLTSAILVGAMAHANQTVAGRSDSKAKPQAQKRILVVEDSITSRVLLKNILESEGFAVTVASDGQDGWEKVLQDSSFNLVVTDVEMPRMTGFELTTKIRKESNCKDVPIIVVTSLASLEDRRKGVEVGANAYFVKSNFEKANLLDMVKRLL